MADIVIRNGRVIDGTGNPWFHADVGISGDRIEYVGHPQGATEPATATIIDAQDMCVCPGSTGPIPASWAATSGRRTSSP